jgi:membrane protease subunit (stomatin/prohibitin family)
MSDTLNKQLRSVIECINPDAETLFERWTENGDEIKNASKLIVGPGQGCLFVYEGKIEGTFADEGVYDLKTDNIPFWTTVKNALYKFESYHKVGIYYYRKADMLNKRWGTPTVIQNLNFLSVSVYLAISLFGSPGRWNFFARL